ncbi:hypothetical protein ACKWTF_014495 [Chironomus riparius]
MNLKIQIFLQILIFLTVKCAKSSDAYIDGTRFQSIECKANNSTALVTFCFIKAVSRKVVTLNVGVKLLKSFNKPLYVQFIVNYRYGLIYREVINTKKQEWCGVMDGKSAHPLLLQIVAQIKGSAPSLFHKCPYEGDVELKNVTLDDQKAFDVFPAGNYKTSVLTFDKNENLIFSMNLTNQVKSAIKESMG